MPRSERTQKRIKLTPAEKEAIYALPLHMQYEVVCVNIATRHRVLQHILVDTATRDYKQVRDVAIAYTEECDCWINPIVDKYSPKGRQKLYPGIEDNANPDLTTTKYGYIDVKSPLNKSNIVSNANSACSQGAIAVLTDFYLRDVLSIYKAKSITFDIFFGRNIDKDGRPNYTKDEVHWFIKGTLYKLNRPGKN